MATKPDETPSDRASGTAEPQKPPAAPESASPQTPSPQTPSSESARAEKPRPVEIGGRKGPDPTRYGDWEKDGRAIDF